MDVIPMDMLLEIFSHLNEPDLARLRCVNTFFKSVVDAPVHPLVVSLHSYQQASTKRHGKTLVRFLHRSKVGLDEGLLVRRFKRWMGHTNNVSFGKYVYRMAKSVQKHDILFEVLHQTPYRYVTPKHEQEYAKVLFDAVTLYIHSLT